MPTMAELAAVLDERPVVGDGYPPGRRCVVRYAIPEMWSQVGDIVTIESWPFRSIARPIKGGRAQSRYVQLVRNHTRPAPTGVVTVPLSWMRPE